MAIPEIIYLGTLFLLVGILLKLFPPKKINSFYGYRTSSSMKSEENWKFAQNYAAIEAMKSGVAMNVIGVFLYFLDIDVKLQTLALIVSLIFFSTYIIVRVEIALKKKSP